LPAFEWLDRTPLDTLAAMLEDNADEPHAARIAAALDARRGAITTTASLADVVRQALAGQVPDDEVDVAVRRVFQALRIAVNDELGTLDALLRQLPACLRPGGRAAVITFHSGEDRRVKKAFEQGVRAGLYTEAAHEVVRVSPVGQRANPRSKSAKLRWARRPGERRGGAERIVVRFV
jgi:16S rRNA (cytosine1402-N4)-methyltransferase